MFWQKLSIINFFRCCENSKFYEDEREDEKVEEEKKGKVNCENKNVIDFSEAYTFKVSKSALHTNEKNSAESSYNYKHDDANIIKIFFNHTNVLPQYNDDNYIIYSPGEIHKIFYNTESISKRSQNNFRYVENITLFKRNTFHEAYDSINSRTSIFHSSVSSYRVL